LGDECVSGDEEKRHADALSGGWVGEECGGAVERSCQAMEGEGPEEELPRRA